MRARASSRARSSAAAACFAAASSSSSSSGVNGRLPGGPLDHAACRRPRCRPPAARPRRDHPAGPRAATPARAAGCPSSSTVISHDARPNGSSSTEREIVEHPVGHLAGQQLRRQVAEQPRLSLAPRRAGALLGRAARPADPPPSPPPGTRRPSRPPRCRRAGARNRAAVEERQRQRGQQRRDQTARTARPPPRRSRSRAGTARSRWPGRPGSAGSSQRRGRRGATTAMSEPAGSGRASARSVSVPHVGPSCHEGPAPAAFTRSSRGPPRSFTPRSRAYRRCCGQADPPPTGSDLSEDLARRPDGHPPARWTPGTVLSGLRPVLQHGAFRRTAHATPTGVQ